MTVHNKIIELVERFDRNLEAYKQDKFNEAQVRREFFGDDFPASTGIIVAGLLGHRALIEINAIAIAPD